MTKKFLSLILAGVLMLCAFSFTATAEEYENAYWVEQGAAGIGDEDDPFGTIEEAIVALGGEDGTIYIYGEYDMSHFDYYSGWDGMITFKPVNADSTLLVENSRGCVFRGDVTMKGFNFEFGESTHMNSVGSKLVFDLGDDVKYDSWIHLGVYGDQTVEEQELVYESGFTTSVFAGGAYTNSAASGVAGDVDITVNGGHIEYLYLNADLYADEQVGMSIGGNLNLVVNGGTIDVIDFMEKKLNDIYGALNIVLNNGFEVVSKLNYPEHALSGTYVVMSKKGGMITPTDEVGVFEVKADAGKVAKINGKLVYDGKVKLEPGETNVGWVKGKQEGSSTVETTKKEIKLVIGKAEIVTNGVAKALDVPAQIVDSRTLVPLRAIFEALGATVEWDGETRTVTSSMGSTNIKLTIDDTNLYVNGTAKTLDVPAMIIDGRTMVPARAVAEAYGCDVAWDGATSTVTITK